MIDNDGFTLLELMIVIAITAIISAMATPSLIGWASNRRIRSAVEEMSAVCQLARLRAIRENENVVIRMDLPNDRCQIFIDDGSGGGTGQNGVQDGTEVSLAPILLPNGVDMYNHTFAQPWFGYTGRGLLINNGFGQIQARNTAGSYLGMAVDMAGNPEIISSDDGGASWN